MGLTIWDKRDFKFDYLTSKIKLKGKKEEIVDIKHYYIRKSNKDKNTIVFDAIIEA